VDAARVDRQESGGLRILHARYTSPFVPQKEQEKFFRGIYFSRDEKIAFYAEL
jgi:hypothetical protein